MKTTPQEFIYWLQGFFEIVNPTSLSPGQTATIKAKLESCFDKVTTAPPKIPVVPMNLGDIYPWHAVELELPEAMTGIVEKPLLEEFNHLFHHKPVPPDWRDTGAFYT